MPSTRQPYRRQNTQTVTQFVLNVSPAEFKDAEVRVGIIPYKDSQQLARLRSTHGTTGSLFPGLIDEDARPKVGPLQPRADIGIPSLRVIVEVKFMRNGDTPKTIIEQIAEDASLYLVQGSKYDSLIPFIWDDSRRTEHHEEMRRGLRQLRGVIDAIIIPRPGSMVVAG